MVGARLFVLISIAPWAARAQRQNQGNEAPKFLSDEGKDLFNDVMQSEQPFGEATCEQREALLKATMGNSDPQAGQLRFFTLKEIGMCEFIKGNYEKAKKRLDSGVSELNLPNEDMMNTNQDLAPIGLFRQAAGFMAKHELTQAGTALRRSREISDRNLKKILKMVHKQMTQQQGGSNAPPLQNLVDEIPGFGKTGQFLPMLVKQVPMLKQELPFVEQLDKAIEDLDKRMVAFAPQQKAIRKALDTSKGKGSLMYVRALVAPSIAPADILMAATDLTEGDAAKSFKEEAASVEKSLTLLKRTKEGTGCKDKGMDKTCAALSKIADLKSNAFGETRVIALKPGKKQALETCSTNANVGIVMAAGDGVSLQVGESKQDLLGGLPVVIDFCQEASLEASKAAVVLFAQSWHPEFAAVERTTEVRARAKAYSLSEDEVKEAANLINAHAKKNWDKAAKQWRETSSLVADIKSALKGAKEEAQKQAEAAEEAKRKEDEDNDEERKKNLEALEKKREEKRRKDAELEEKRKARKKQLEEERANRDPWLNDPEVLEAEKKLADLKEARRDANAKLEFDLTAQLTKDISAAERNLKKVTKKAKKAFKKGGGKPAEGEAKAEKGSGDKASEIKKQLEEISKQKKEAAANDNFKEAKKLKEKEKELQAQLKKLEL